MNGFYKPVLTILFIGILFCPSYIYADPPTLNIPPPNTYWHYVTQNGTSSAQSPYDTLKLEGQNGTKVHNEGNGTIIIIGSGNGSSSFTPITCTTNHALGKVDAGGIFTCYPINSTSSGSTFDTIQNIGGGQASIYAGNTTKTNFQFKTVSCSGSAHCTNGTSLVTIKSDTFQNNTGSNLGTHGIGPFSSMLGSVLQFLSLVSANNQLLVTSNSTNIILTIQHVITDAFKSNSITCVAGQFFSAFSNSTGTYTCSSPPSAPVHAITAGNGISVNGTTGTVKVTNTGVLSANAGTGISVNATNGNVLITNPTGIAFNETYANDKGIANSTHELNFINGTAVQTLVKLATAHDGTPNQRVNVTITCATCITSSNQHGQGIIINGFNRTSFSGIQANTTKGIVINGLNRTTFSGISANETDHGQGIIINGLNRTTFSGVSANETDHGQGIIINGNNNTSFIINRGSVTNMSQVLNTTNTISYQMKPNVVLTNGSKQTFTKSLDLGGPTNNQDIFNDMGIVIRNPAHTFATTISNSAQTGNTTILIPILTTTGSATHQIPFNDTINTFTNSNTFTNNIFARTYLKFQLFGLANATLASCNTGLFLSDPSDTSKGLCFNGRGSTTGKSLVIAENQTSSQKINIPNIRETETLAVQPQSARLTNATGQGTTITTSFIMVHYPVSITPQINGNVTFTFTGNLGSATATDGCNIQIFYSTGTAPHSGAPTSGTQLGITEGNIGTKDLIGWQFTATGLTVGSTYWFEPAIEAVTGSTCTISNAMETVRETQ